MIGESIGSFRIVSRLGSGGMGEVFLAEQPNIDTRVAIKVLRLDVSTDKDHVQRFFNEARAVGRIKHSGIVKIFEGGFHSSGNAFLIMEHLEGETLASRIARTGQLSAGSVCDLGRQIASILHATHAVGITHRDLKPENVFIVADAELESGERVKVLDFGIAKLTGTLVAKPGTVGTMGTPAYMAPEQWGDSASVDWRADAYSLGCVLFEMACGRPPFTGATFADFCAKHLTTAPPVPSTLGVELPPALEALILRLLAKDAAQRATSMSAIGRDLETIGKPLPLPQDSTLRPGIRQRVAEPGTGAPPAQTTLGGAAGERSPRRSSRGGMFAIASVAVVGGAIALGWTLRGRDREPAHEVVASADAAVVTRDASLAASTDAAGAVAAIPATLRERIEAVNPFVSVNGVLVQRHQATRDELDWYLGSLRAADVAAAGPLIPSQGRAAGGMTFERARRFCRAIGADLPTSAEWATAAGTAWGIDAGEGRGPLQEWTSTVEESLVTVRGAHAGMTEAARAEALADPLLKVTEQFGGIAEPRVVADPQIGFRCLRDRKR